MKSAEAKRPMTIDTFFEKFEVFADAPDAVERMRELILQLAVRGKLVEQERSESCAAQLVGALEISRLASNESENTDPPFAIPSNWGWIPLGRTMRLINGHPFKPDDWSVVGVPIIRIQNLNNNKAPFNRTTKQIDQKVHVNDGDFLISWSGTPGTSFGAFIWNRGFAYLNQHIFRCVLVDGIFIKEYLRLAINSRLDEMIAHAQGAVGLQHITKGKLESINLTLPPLAEQKRIVAKVDELMALCDRLEAQLKDRDARAAALARASLERFSADPSPANLDFLFHSSYAISPEDLRKAVLGLAVRGKLVKQKKGDGNISQLLLAISNERRDKKATSFPLEEPDWEGSKESPYQLPVNWAWTNLGRIALKIQYGYTASADPSLTEIRMLRITDIQNNRVDWSSVPGCQIEEITAQRYLLVANDILIARTGGTIGKSFIVPDMPLKSVFASYLIRVSPPSSIEAKYLKYFLESPLYWEQLRRLSAGTGQPNVNGQALSRLIIPLPPLAEQKRIVAKVDELMVLVDRLESDIAASREKAKALLAAAVAELVQ